MSYATDDDLANSREMLAAMIIATGTTAIDAADKLGVDRSTIRRWMQKPAFRQTVITIRQQATERTLNQYVNSLVDAFATIHQIATSDSHAPRDRLKAAIALCDFALKFGVHFDLAQRVQALEESSLQAKATV